MIDEEAKIRIKPLPPNNFAATYQGPALFEFDVKGVKCRVRSILRDRRALALYTGDVLYPITSHGRGGGSLR